MKESKYLKDTMDLAHELQFRYNILGAPQTQNVRNPMPMHQLVLTVLPTLPDPSAIVEAKQIIKTTVLGKSFLKTQTVKVNAYDTLGRAYYNTHGLSVDEIMGILEAKGFIAHRSSVTMALNSARWNNKAQSMRFTKPRTSKEIMLGIRRNTSYCRYFAIAS